MEPETDLAMLAHELGRQEATLEANVVVDMDALLASGSGSSRVAVGSDAFRIEQDVVAIASAVLDDLTDSWFVEHDGLLESTDEAHVAYLDTAPRKLRSQPRADINAPAPFQVTLFVCAILVAISVACVGVMV